MKKRSLAKNILTIALFALGTIFIIHEIIVNSSTSIRCLFIKTDHPARYNFSLYDALLHRYVRSGCVDYRALQQTTQLKAAVAELEHISPDRLPLAQDKLAFWINAFNLLTMKNICQRYPIVTIQQMQSVPARQCFIIGGKTYSTSDIEHDLLHPLLITECPDAVFLICHGMRGDPPLLAHAITGANLKTDAAKALADFVLDRRHWQINTDKHLFAISQFYKWHAGIFSSGYGNAFALVNKYLPPDAHISADNLADFRYEYLPQFDWTINDMSNPDSNSNSNSSNNERLPQRAIK